MNAKSDAIKNQWYLDPNIWDLSALTVFVTRVMNKKVENVQSKAGWQRSRIIEFSMENWEQNQGQRMNLLLIGTNNSGKQKLFYELNNRQYDCTESSLNEKINVPIVQIQIRLRLIHKMADLLQNWNV